MWCAINISSSRELFNQYWSKNSAAGSWLGGGIRPLLSWLPCQSLPTNSQSVSPAQSWHVWRNHFPPVQLWLGRPSHCQVVIIEIFILDLNRSPKQFYVFFTLEAAAHRQGGLRNRIDQLNKIPGFFNLTMTYRHDSDIPAPYGQFEGREGRQPPSGDQLEKYIRRFGQDNQQMAEKKGSQGLRIAQYVSNCETAVGRENLVDMIDYLTQVDIYGNCGDFYCSQMEGQFFSLSSESPVLTELPKSLYSSTLPNLPESADSP